MVAGSPAARSLYVSTALGGWSRGGWFGTSSGHSAEDIGTSRQPMCARTLQRSGMVAPCTLPSNPTSVLTCGVRGREGWVGLGGRGGDRTLML